MFPNRLSEQPSHRAREPFFQDGVDPWLIGLVAVMAIIHGALILLGPEARMWSLVTFAFWPARMAAGDGLQPIWSLFSYAFLHGGWGHLMMNGAICLSFGSRLIGPMGRGRFFAVFFAAAAAGALTLALIRWGQAIPLIGASGGVMGLWAAFEQRHYTETRMMGGDARAVLGRFVAQMIMMHALIFAIFGVESIAWEAHLGGLAAGWLMAPWAFGRRG